MLKNVIVVSAMLIVSSCYSFSEEAKDKKNDVCSTPIKEEAVATKHVVTISGKEIPYTATAGTLIHRDEKGADKASFFYIAYVKDSEIESSERPITFCFNGGPGSSSVWLHLGTFGPRCVDLFNGQSAEPPYHLIDNEYSLLDTTDLVFIDPISTGYSRVAEGKDAKEYHGVDEDIKSIAEFIRLYVTKNERWDSPKFLAGESYGTTRAAGLVAELHDEAYMYFNGILLVSSVLDFQTLKCFEKGNDLPYILTLPSYTTAALYHKKLSDVKQKDPVKTRKEAEEFAMNDYALALLKGDTLDQEKRTVIIETLSALTGISKEYIDDADLRLNPFQFRKELLHDKKRCVGRFDSRYLGIEISPMCEYALSDPSAEAVFGPFTASFNQYIRKELNWKKDEKYEILANVQPWNFGKASNQYLNVATSLREVMSKNPKLHVFVANGYYDLATPYFATEYTFNHLNLDPSLKDNVTMDYYDAGHMMYIDKASFVKLNRDVKLFIHKSLSRK